MQKSLQYKESVVCLVDILGFKELLIRSSASEVLNFLSLKESFKIREWQPRTRKFRSHSFSDLIVTCRQLPERLISRRSFFILLDEIIRMGFHQARLAMAGVFVRGGLTVGPIFSSAKHVFGPALVHAYETENERAKWPIIAIDSALVDTLIASVPVCVEQAPSSGFDFEKGASTIHILAWIFQYLHRTKEGTYFIDYINCLSHIDETTGDLHYYLGDHKKQICLARIHSCHPKLEFIASYHNLKCMKFYPELSSLLIPGVEAYPDSDWPAAVIAGLREIGLTKRERTASDCH